MDKISEDFEKEKRDLFVHFSVAITSEDITDKLNQIYEKEESKIDIELVLMQINSIKEEFLDEWNNHGKVKTR